MSACDCCEAGDPYLQRYQALGMRGPAPCRPASQPLTCLYRGCEVPRSPVKASAQLMELT